ncbi:MAG: RNA polymerase factor sigma-54 [Candidatus Aminicenantes bacterium]|nr:RNA polymerase factor sigma-54 [Candidatus Aminicenantes bacterium]
MIKQKLDQKQVQKLVLAPALQQAIKLLQLTNLELQEVVDAELEENPVLEIDERQDEAAAADQELIEAETTPEGEEGRVSQEDELDEIIFAAGFQDYLEDEPPHFGYEEREEVNYENIISKQPTLWEHLNWQANLTFNEPEELEIAEFIIGNINEDGYLTLSVEEIAGQLQKPVEKVEEVREKIKMLDPPGCGSLNLKECLLAQMDSLNLQDEVARRIVAEYLPLLQKADLLELSRILGLEMSELKLHLDLIKNLDPTPGRKYSESKDIYVVPDIFVVKEDGEWKVYLNEEGLPRLKLNSYYQQLARSGLQNDQETSRFLKEKIKKAIWFIRSLEQRHRTIYRVATYIVNKQKDFLEKGIDFLKPMTLIEVAREMGLHESTIGRVVANKYMMTPRGLYPLKFFFHKSLSGVYGEEISSLRIKERIRKLIENEDKNNPLSDDEIVEILSREKIQIARRTVAKYRDQLGIPSSHIRKKKFLIEEVK